MFSHRDTAVIPWLPEYQRSPSSGGPKTSATSAASPNKQSCKIIRLLSARERIGLKSKCTRVGSLSEGVLVSNEELSRAGAWNIRRLQNMILAIGPGTPASCVLSSVPSAGGATDGGGDDSDSVSSNDEDDIFDPDSNEEEEEDVEMLDDEELEEENEEYVDSEDDGSEEKESETNRYFEMSPSNTHVESDEGFRLDVKKSLDEKKPESHDDVMTSGDDQREVEREIERQLAARPSESERDPEDEQEHQQRITGQRTAWTRRAIGNSLPGDGDNFDDDSQYTHNDSDNNATLDEIDHINESRARQAEQVIEFLHNQVMRQQRRLRRSHRHPVSTVSRGSNLPPPQRYEREVARSMKHGGCINTACWLDCGWRISTVSHEDAHPYDRFYNNVYTTSHSHSSNDSQWAPSWQRSSYNDGLAVLTSPSEYPTQLITSGDDHLVKFWDVYQSMGSTSPLPGGSSTINPFSSPRVPMGASSELITRWREHVNKNDDDSDEWSSIHKQRRYLPGIVHPLLTLSTGHRGNVFHATPVPYTPGKVLTCAADGYLRLTDVEINATSSPAALQRGRSASTSSASIVGEASTIIISPEYRSENGESETSFQFRDSLMCFSHHFLTSNVGLVCSERGLLHFDLRLPPSSQKRGSLVEELSATCKSCCVLSKHNEESDSAYVFAGGSGTDVALYDLRMTGRPSSQAVQRYRPRPLRQKSAVSVSGIELSKDKRELLVAYESDQCYTFPVFPESSVAGQTISNKNASSDHSIVETKPVSELAQYGGHLNRLTFLKMAKYAGPHDEYICTGSDSGHAWIYEKRSGSVAAFLRADHSTCNGILPHPSLPYFITYGIDSTVKLWRATIPVDNDIDDSDAGRYAFSQKGKYDKSIVCDKWKASRKRNPVDLDNEEISFFPNETPDEDVVEDSFSIGFMGILFARSRSSNEMPFIGNDLSNLNIEIRKNYFLCARSASLEEDIPVKSGLTGLKRRMSLIKLRHQADRLGLNWECAVPWDLSFKDHLLATHAKRDDLFTYGAAADLIPDPSDWIPYHTLMANPPLLCGMQFCKRHKQFYHELYVDKSIHPVSRGCMANDRCLQVHESKAVLCESLPKLNEQPDDLDKNEKNDHIYEAARAWDILYRTVTLLKEAGNAALQKKLNCLAARYYDKAIVYCSVAYMEFPTGNVDFLADHQVALSDNSGWECYWTGLLKTLIQIRLNLSLCCLKSDVNDTKAAIFQAKLALKELRPFVAKKGCVKTGKKLEKTRLEEPPTTYTEAMSLQSKAFFRLGSGQLLLGDFEEAIESFEQSIKSSSASSPEKKPDQVVLRKLQEAKVANRRQFSSERKKFKFMFSSQEDRDTNTR
eukprot:CCRYP_013390-RA/>CCRYP_013390-RA protein AED:0.06 eAED:0.06 QI:92/1/1/1/1/1/7/170/1345